MTQKLNAFMLGLLLMGVLGQPVLADAGNRGHGLSPEELAFVFGDPNADGFEILSPQEMAEIEGRWTFFALRRAFNSGALHVWSRFGQFMRRLGSYRITSGIHPPHHGMGRHFEVIIYRPGVSGSHRKFRDL